LSKQARGHFIRTKPRKVVVDPGSDEAKKTEEARIKVGNPSLVEETQAKQAAQVAAGEQQG